VSSGGGGGIRSRASVGRAHISRGLLLEATPAALERALHRGVLARARNAATAPLASRARAPLST
jgi:hypothetical protein